MDIIEYVKNNFLGMSYKDQQTILEYLMVSLKENKLKKLSRDFHDKFNDYLQKIKYLYNFKEFYNNFNSDERRLTRKILLDKLIYIVDNHHIDYSDERIKQYFMYSSIYYGEYNRYFEIKFVSSDVAKNFLIEYTNLSLIGKSDFIKELIYLYDRINYLSLPFPNNMIKEYRPIIYDLIGDELIKYYDILYTEEQIQLILGIVEEFNMFNNDINYYNRTNKNVKENPIVIRMLKKEAIDLCKRKL